MMVVAMRNGSFLRKTLAFGLALASVVALAGCDDPPPVTPTVPTVPPSFTVFSGRLEQMGSVQFFYQFIEAPALFRVTLTGVTVDGQKRALDTPLHMQVGAPIVDGCQDAFAADIQAGLTANVVGTLPIGTYCIQVKDVGGLPQAADITVRLVIVPLDPSDSTATETFSSTLALDGFSSKSFLVKQPGNARVTLTSLGAPAGTTVALGLGVQGSNEVGCRLSKIVRAAPGTEFTSMIDPGFYCLAVLDSSTPQNETPFTVTVAHP